MLSASLDLSIWHSVSIFIEDTQCAPTLNLDPCLCIHVISSQAFFAVDGGTKFQAQFCSKAANAQLALNYIGWAPGFDSSHVALSALAYRSCFTLAFLEVDLDIMLTWLLAVQCVHIEGRLITLMHVQHGSHISHQERKLFSTLSSITPS